MDNVNLLPFGFFLNVEMLYEVLNEKGLAAVLFRKGGNISLTGVQYYLGQEQLSEGHVYLASSTKLAEKPFCACRCALVVIGDLQPDTVCQDCGCITLPETEEIHSVSNIISEAFIRYAILEKKLNEILNNHGGFMDICGVALKHFNNPVFIHDEYYNILACPQIIEGVTNFTFNGRTQRYMQSVDTLNAFRISPAYRQTLETQGGQIWDSDFSKDFGIYANIWINNEYKGRLVIPGVFSEIRPIQLAEATYFAEIIKLVMMRHFTEADGDLNPLKSFVVDAVNGFKIDSVLLESRIAAQNWSMDDHYVCGVMSFLTEGMTHLSVFAMCNDIESHISGS